MADVKERPILFSAPMVRALLDGRKTQTRRVAKPQQLKVTLPRMIHGDWPIGHRVIAQPGVYPATMNQYGAVAVRVGESLLGVKPDEFEWFSPYGKPGDRLWVRETWSHSGTGVWSIADVPMALSGSLLFRATDTDANVSRWFPSIFMPRWASRITLEVTEVRVERLQDISELDAKAEGVDAATTWVAECGVGPYNAAYSTLWDEINGAGSWDANPWVWALTFRKLAAAGQVAVA